jgi:hypothetical protein
VTTGPGRATASSGWRNCVPELVITGCLAIVTAGAVYAYAGVGTAALALLAWAVVLLIALRGQVPAASEPVVQQLETWRGAARTSVTGYWRKVAILTDSTANMASYDAELRPALQHLLAARLAERHDISLYADPAAARRVLLRGGRDDELWFWLDPARPARSEQGRPGIPPRTLAAIIDRLERL